MQLRLSAQLTTKVDLFEVWLAFRHKQKPGAHLQVQMVVRLGVRVEGVIGGDLYMGLQS